MYRSCMYQFQFLMAPQLQTSFTFITKFFQILAEGLLLKNQLRDFASYFIPLSKLHLAIICLKTTLEQYSRDLALSIIYLLIPFPFLFNEALKQPFSARGIFSPSVSPVAALFWDTFWNPGSMKGVHTRGITHLQRTAKWANTCNKTATKSLQHFVLRSAQ